MSFKQIIKRIENLTASQEDLKEKYSPNGKIANIYRDCIIDDVENDKKIFGILFFKR